MYVYILKCEGSCLYTGIAADPEKRLRQHLGLIKGGAKFTVSHPVKCVMAIWEDTTGQYVRSLEGQIKNRLTHAEKLQLCKKPRTPFSEFGLEVSDDAFVFIDPTDLNEKYSLL